MTIKQSIKYNSNNGYFAGFLQNMIQQSGVNGSVKHVDGYITLSLDDDQQERLTSFGKLAERYLPASLFLDEVTTTQGDRYMPAQEFVSDTYNISLCPQCLEALTTPAGSEYLNDNLVCTHYNHKAAESFTDHKSYSPHYSQGATLLVVDAGKLQDLFIMTDEEIQALLCIEKPTIKVTIKDEGLKELTGKNYLKIQAPLSVRSTLVALNARQSDVPYLFFHDDVPFYATVVKNHTIIIEDQRGLGRPLVDLDEDPIVNRFLNISHEAGFDKDALGVYLSSKQGICFMASNDMGSKKVIEFQPFVAEDVLRSMGEDPTRAKLLTNFYKRYPEVMDELLGHEYDLFATLCTILGLDGRDFEALSDKSLEFRGNGGLKIDMFFNEAGFDYSAFLGSVMSFKLADTDNAYLAYSIFEAFADMATATLTQLKTKLMISNFVMLGDMFSNTVLYSRILSKFETNHPYFSKQSALDG